MKRRRECNPSPTPKKRSPSSEPCCKKQPSGPNSPVVPSQSTDHELVALTASLNLNHVKPSIRQRTFHSRANIQDNCSSITSSIMLTDSSTRINGSNISTADVDSDAESVEVIPLSTPTSRVLPSPPASPPAGVEVETEPSMSPPEGSLSPPEISITPPIELPLDILYTYEGCNTLIPWTFPQSGQLVPAPILHPYSAFYDYTQYGASIDYSNLSYYHQNRLVQYPIPAKHRADAYKRVRQSWDRIIVQMGYKPTNVDYNQGHKQNQRVLNHMLRVPRPRQQSVSPPSLNVIPPDVILLLHDMINLDISLPSLDVLSDTLGYDVLTSASFTVNVALYDITNSESYYNKQLEQHRRQQILKQQQLMQQQQLLEEQRQKQRQQQQQSNAYNSNVQRKMPMKKQPLSLRRTRATTTHLSRHVRLVNCPSRHGDPSRPRSLTSLSLNRRNINQLRRIVVQSSHLLQSWNDDATTTDDEPSSSESESLPIQDEDFDVSPSSPKAPSPHNHDIPE